MPNPSTPHESARGRKTDTPQGKFIAWLPIISIVAMGLLGGGGLLQELRYMGRELIIIKAEYKAIENKVQELNTGQAVILTRLSRMEEDIGRLVGLRTRDDTTFTSPSRNLDGARVPDFDSILERSGGTGQ